MDPAAEQSAVGAAQVFPQAPQLSGAVRLVSQPSSARTEQCAYPGAHAAAGTLHTPEWQVMPVAPALTFGSAVQSWPQPPQLSGSDVRLTQLLPQLFGADVGQLDMHCGPLGPDAHRDVVPVHFIVQPPHVWASSSEASQPSSARDEQCV
ncbi:MAG TPA: hypothetical protein VHH90_10890 [Polyangia bacterium]|nr:hypothetical protein [Polyangia bacterium]